MRISGAVALSDVEDAIYENTIYKPAVIVANKLDLPGAQTNLQKLKAHVNGKLPIIPMSCEHKMGMEELGKAIFESLALFEFTLKNPAPKCTVTTLLRYKKAPP